MTDPSDTQRPALAIALKLLAIGIFVTVSALVKATSDDVPPGEAVFFRSAFAIPVILIWLTARKELRHGLIPNNLRGHMMRGVIGTTAMGMSFAGLALIPLPEAMAIGFATPIFTLVLAVAMLGERIRMFRIGAVTLGLVGVTIMLWPRLGTVGAWQNTATLGALLILGATLCRSLVQIHIRQLVQTEHTAAVVFYFSLIASFLSLLTLPFGWTLPNGETLAILVLCGTMGGIGQMLITTAYRFGPASMLAPYDYSSMLYAILIGYVWFNELPTAIILSGAALVVVGNLVVLWRERQLGREPAQPPSLAEPRA